MKDNSSDNTGLTAAQISKFKTLLLAKRNEILGNVISMEDEALHRQRSDLSNMPIHMADIGTDNYEIEYTLGLVDSERKLMREIDEALDRIENCTYGICEGSGKSIPKARLEAIPWARYCVEYARLLEKGLVREKDSFIESIFSDQTDEEQDEDSDGATEYESD
ncbi:MAG: TraR/DksA C4-type zinc finger protein [Sedimentisphaerales bacterium]|nr:TraR/DksA C4-type zinc finger protein [Sedimentisphaerales bacterium]